MAANGKKVVVRIWEESEAEQGMSGKQSEWHASYSIRTTCRIILAQGPPRVSNGTELDNGL